MHQQLLAEVVRPGDVFINVFPKHQKEIEEHNYPGEIQEILDPAEFTTQLCSCRAIISTRLHGIILGLHMGVPTFGAFHASYGNKVPELMLDVIRLPEQFLVINEHLNRDIVDLQVEAVRRLYVSRGRRSYIHARLSEFHDQFEAHAKHVLFDVIGVERAMFAPASWRESAGETRPGSSQKQTVLINAPSNDGGGTFSRPQSAGFIRDDIPGRGGGGGVEQTVANNIADNADQETLREKSAQGGGLSNIGGQEATVPGTLAAEQAGLSETLQQGAADPSTLLKEVISHSPGTGVETPKNPVPAGTGARTDGSSKRLPSDQGGSIAGVLLANRSAFKTSAEESDEKIDGTNNAHHAAEHATRDQEESATLKAPVRPGTDEPGAAPNARDDDVPITDAANPHSAIMKNTVAGMNVVVPQTQTTNDGPAGAAATTAGAGAGAAAVLLLLLVVLLLVLRIR